MRISDWSSDVCSSDLFAGEDRILFLRNEKSMGVKNGTLGTVERASAERLAVRLDNGERVDVDLKLYAHVDHGYAATIHKSQGMTVDRSHVQIGRAPV